ncbi:hypothetical protein [Aquabacterium humicola]|uniref:hypothetical protein n=1 Tax=Aquabacterium humicola TaxID=3237377 RepID=UPI002543A720|nr:hypothetical protein [Rubrivivax pictus]
MNDPSDKRTHRTTRDALKTPHPTTADIPLARRAAEAAVRANTKPSMSLRDAEARVAGARLTQERYDAARAPRKRLDARHEPDRDHAGSGRHQPS